MTILTIPATLLAAIAVIYLLYIFVVLSRKLGAVTKAKPHYRWLYVSIGLLIFAAVSQWLILSADTLAADLPGLITNAAFHFLARTLPLLVAIVIALIVIMRYWSWLFRETDL